MKLEFVPLTFKDACDIAEDAEPRQYGEWCSLADYPSSTSLAREVFEHSVLKWCVKLDGKPMAMIGASYATRTTLNAWCLAKKNAPKRVWAFMRRKGMAVVKYLFKNDKYDRIHAYVCTDRTKAHTYAEKAGFKYLYELQSYGKDHDFRLYNIYRKDVCYE